MYIQTPLLESFSLGKLSNKNVYLKMENCQPVGSFKIRGLSNLCLHLKEQGVKHFISSSGGNAGYTVAYLGKKLNIPTTVFLPEVTPQLYIERIRSMGAEVVKKGAVFDDSNQHAVDFATKHNYGFIHPFDHPLIWSGHSSIIDEIVDSKIIPDAIVTSVGGAGLMCGLIEGLHRHKLSHIPIIAIEPIGAAALYETLEEKRIVTLDKIDTIAKTLAAKTVTSQVLYWMKRHTIIPIKVSDESMSNACYKFANKHRMLVEPACGATLSVFYDQIINKFEFNNIIAIVCGGIGVTIDDIVNNFGL